MKRSYLAAVLTLVCVLGIGVSARAQDTNTVVVKIPFEFLAGGATLPAGEYRISRVTSGLDRELAISGYGKEGAFLLPLTFDDGPSSQATLSFEHTGGRYFLSAIKTLGGVYTIATPQRRISLAQTKNQGSMSSGSN
jgi:hypothetical protein